LQNTFLYIIKLEGRHPKNRGHYNTGPVIIGTYEFFPVICFGLKDDAAVQTFRRFINGVLQRLDFAFALVDDFPPSACIAINPGKCVFGVSEVGTHFSQSLSW